MCKKQKTLKFLIPCLVLACLISLNGCARKHRVQYPSSTEPVVHPSEVPESSKQPETTAIPGQVSEPTFEQPPPSTVTVPTQPTLPPYVPKTGSASAVYADAEKNYQEGKLDKAEMLLERALRIEPRNAHYWYTMAKLKFDQGQYKDTVQFCLKSNSLAAGIPQLVTLNNRLIADAKAKQQP